MRWSVRERTSSRRNSGRTRRRQLVDLSGDAVLLQQRFLLAKLSGQPRPPEDEASGTRRTLVKWN